MRIIFRSYKNLEHNEKTFAEIAYVYVMHAGISYLGTRISLLPVPF